MSLNPLPACLTALLAAASILMVIPGIVSTVLGTVLLIVDDEAPLATAVAGDSQLFRPGRPLDDVIAALRSLQGIGEWTAHYIAMREMREPDAFPPGDVGLLRAMADADGRRPSAAALLAPDTAEKPATANTVPVARPPGSQPNQRRAASNALCVMPA